MENLQRFTELGDGSGVETIWTSCVTCLGYLAALSHLISQGEPILRSSMNDLCDLTDLSREVHVEAYSYFDALTEVRYPSGFSPDVRALTKDATQISWQRALDTIDARIGLYSHVESGSLRHLRGVIGKVHADFQAGLQGCGPSELMSMALLIDGRTADSKYPNLMLHDGRKSYGF